MATHSRILAWRIPWTEESVGLYSSCGCKESDMTERLNRRRSMDNFIFGFFLLLSLFFLLGLSHHASMVTIFVRGPFSLSQLPCFLKKIKELSFILVF